MNPDAVRTRTALAAALADVQARIAEMADVEAQLKAQILATTDGPDRYDAGPLTVVVTQAQRLDLAAIAAKYPPDVRPELYEQTVTTDAVRRHIAPDDLDAFMKPSKPSVRIQ